MALGLTIETVWSDDDMLEFQLSASSNETFSGRAAFYVARDEAEKLARYVAGYPSDRSDIREYKFGNSENSYEGFAELLFTCQDGAGHLRVVVNLWGELKGDRREHVSLIIHTLPGEIDSFVEELNGMGVRIGATAHLRDAHAT
jgi:hypothetical protein